MATVTKDELVQILIKKKGTTIVNLKATTNARLKKTNNPHGSCSKQSELTGMIGWNYANSVNNQRAREDHQEFFEAEPRAWGERVKGTPLVEHKGNYYLEMKVTRVMSTTFIRDRDGEIVTHAEIVMFLPPARENARAETVKGIFPSDYAVENIKEITLDGVHYTVTK